MKRFAVTKHKHNDGDDDDEKQRYTNLVSETLFRTGDIVAHILAYASPDHALTAKIGLFRRLNRMLYRFTTDFIRVSDDIRITDACVRTLPHLKELRLSDWKLTQAVIRSQTNLEKLIIFCNYPRQLPYYDERELFRPLSANLHTLELDGAYNGIHSIGFDCLTALRHLVLRNYTVVNDSLLRLQTRLTALTLHGHHREIADRGITPLTNLTSLRLDGYTGLTNDTLWPLTRLTTLEITNEPARFSPINNDGISRLTSLTSLNLENNACVTGAALSHLTNLTSLNLAHTGAAFTTDDVADLTQLVTLNVHRCTHIHHAALIILLPRLRFLYDSDIDMQQTCRTLY